MRIKKTELLAPAGSMEKMKYAIAYGADAVYCGVPDFSLRVRINNFSVKDLEKAAAYVHERGKKIYVTLNIYAHNRHLPLAEKHLKALRKIGVDGVIISDPGLIVLARKYLPQTEIHLSTQANATNWQAVKFWKEAGVKRVILAREVTLAEIKDIRKKVPEIELEYFVHGAMCMSYSGRCILSGWMTGRSANLGDCSQPCRWGYKTAGKIWEMNVKDDLERYGMDVEEDRHGTYFFNSYDMNLLDHLQALREAGIDSFKIEGRAKSVYYVSVVTRAYRKVLDVISGKYSQEELRKIVDRQKKELDRLAHRGYSTGFLFGKEPAHNFESRSDDMKYKFVGEVMGERKNMNIVKVHNEIMAGDEIEAVGVSGNKRAGIIRMFDWDGKEKKEAHGGHEGKYLFEFDTVLPERTLLRKKL